MSVYLQHFGMRESPFSITPDTSYFMNRAGYQDALNVLLVALRSGEGFIKVTGEVGVGKTMLCRKLLNTLGEGFVTAYIHNPYLQPDTLLLAIADELAVKYPDNPSQHTLLKTITNKLLEYHRGGKSVVLCLDEVQAMPIQTLETLRLLTNIETEKRKLLQVVLFGQPELDQLLEQPSIRQLKQRITFSYVLLPLNRVAVSTYLRHRLAVAGCGRKDVISPQAAEFLQHASNGIPRLINILCNKALMVAYGEGESQVKLRHMRHAAKDMVETQQMRRSLFDLWLPAYTRWGLGILLILAIAAALQAGRMLELFP